MKPWKSLQEIEREHEERVRRLKLYDRILYAVLGVSILVLACVWFTNNPL